MKNRRLRSCSTHHGVLKLLASLVCAVNLTVCVSGCSPGTAADQGPSKPLSSVPKDFVTLSKEHDDGDMGEHFFVVNSHPRRAIVVTLLRKRKGDDDQIRDVEVVAGMKSEIDVYHHSALEPDPEWTITGAKWAQ